MATLEHAIALAVQAHQGQREKNGDPYILHPLRIMLRMRSEAAMIVAMLHDVVEDTSVTLDDLHEHGFAPAIVEAVDCLTRRSTETYEEFVQRTATNALAKQVTLRTH